MFSVKKKNGNLCFFVDYEALNTVTIMDYIPIQMVEELFMSFRKHVFSKELATIK